MGIKVLKEIDDENIIIEQCPFCYSVLEFKKEDVYDGDRFGEFRTNCPVCSEEFKVYRGYES